MKYCSSCGTEIIDTARVCHHCGVAQVQILRTTKAKSKVAAGLFAIFLGGLGIHKFYLGRIGWGIVYLLFCWTGIPEVLGIIEGIIYFLSSDNSFDRKYNSGL